MKCNLFAQLAHLMAFHSHCTSAELRTGDADGSYFLAGLCLWWYINAPAKRCHKLKPLEDTSHSIAVFCGQGIHRDCSSRDPHAKHVMPRIYIKRLVICYLTLPSIYFCSRAKIVYFHCHKFWWPSWPGYKSSSLIPLLPFDNASLHRNLVRMASVLIAFPISCIDCGLWTLAIWKNQRKETPHASAKCQLFEIANHARSTQSQPFSSPSEHGAKWRYVFVR